jgi:hypothetical protein
MQLPLTGACCCGAVRYEIRARPTALYRCHCTDCQRQTGGPFSVIVGVPRAALEVEGDTLSSYATVGEDHGQETERSFCSRCGTPVFSFAAAMPDIVFLKAGSLDDSSWVQPSVEVWTRSAQPWTPAFEQTARLERGPGGAPA